VALQRGWGLWGNGGKRPSSRLGRVGVGCFLGGHRGLSALVGGISLRFGGARASLLGSERGGLQLRSRLLRHRLALPRRRRQRLALCGRGGGLALLRGA